jgi:hypothetical protein
MTDPVTGLIDVKNIPVPGKQTAEFNAFIGDPGKSIKIFMTSHAKAKGYITSKANLDCIPRVLHHFVKFLIQRNVFPQIEDQLRRSLEVISIAMIELPNTWNISKDFPDKFNLACNSCWGKKADGYTSQVEPVDDSALDEPRAKRHKCNADAPWSTGSNWSAGTEGWGQDITMIENSGWAQLDVDKPESTGGDWSAGTEGWGQDITMIENSGWAKLDIDKPESLLSFLGPTAFPLTHSPGIVERSMRRIVSITRPPPSVAKSPPLPEGIYEPDAHAVELELDRRFAKVVLTPMIDWDGGESPVYTKPAILVTSRGAVVRVVARDHDTAASPTPVQGSSPQPPYNPQSDHITLLIDNIDSQINYLRVGMAIGGTWVQLVREGGPVVAKGKKGESEKSSYWYLDELALVVPSFWTIED